ncbi:MAG: hypothetical protein M1817_004958 [Caeruleum heppii]|nr:MAG: hypothetical protein M1817_004958 [Caeruleum heppii]
MKHTGMNMPKDGGGDQPMCNMNMLFTLSTQNLCIIFSQWRITGPFSLLVSLLAIVALTAGYEFVRDVTRRYEARCALDGNALPETGERKREWEAEFCVCRTEDDDRLAESSSLLWSGRNAAASGGGRSGKMGRAALYAVQVFYSFFIMLLFMTYNGWIMLAVAVGAFVGYMVWGNAPATKSVACH